MAKDKQAQKGLFFWSNPNLPCFEAKPQVHHATCFNSEKGRLFTHTAYNPKVDNKLNR